MSLLYLKSAKKLIQLNELKSKIKRLSSIYENISHTLNEISYKFNIFMDNSFTYEHIISNSIEKLSNLNEKINFSIENPLLLGEINQELNYIEENLIELRKNSCGLDRIQQKIDEFFEKIDDEDEKEDGREKSVERRTRIYKSITRRLDLIIIQLKYRDVVLLRFDFNGNNNYYEMNERIIGQIKESSKILIEYSLVYSNNLEEYIQFNEKSSSLKTNSYSKKPKMNMKYLFFESESIQMNEEISDNPNRSIKIKSIQSYPIILIITLSKIFSFDEIKKIINSLSNTLRLQLSFFRKKIKFFSSNSNKIHIVISAFLIDYNNLGSQWVMRRIRNVYNKIKLIYKKSIGKKVVECGLYFYVIDKIFI